MAKDLDLRCTVFMICYNIYNRLQYLQYITIFTIYHCNYKIIQYWQNITIFTMFYTIYNTFDITIYSQYLFLQFIWYDINIYNIYDIAMY